MGARFLLVLLLLPALLAAQGSKGYYRFPAIHGDTVVFTAEGDLWAVGIGGGLARRLTSHPAEETGARFSPDGKTLAFTGHYEGAREVYTMAASGGSPARRTFGGGTAMGWTPDVRILFATNVYASRPRDLQLATIDAANHIARVPLQQASQGVYDAAGKTLFFTRLMFQGSHAKRYQGGSAQQLWKFTAGAPEAAALTADYAGTSRDAMYWKGRVYFASDRDGTMNIWSMDENGRNLRQHTRHQGWDIQNPQLGEGRVVYQLGADVHLYDIAAGAGRKLEIEIVSDFDHLRERWVRQPLEYTTSIRLSPDGDRLAMVARGRVFVAPAKQGRLVEASGRAAARFRSAQVMPDGKDLLVLSTESGEVELWKIPANGSGPGERLTSDGKVLRWEAIPSPDGKWAVHSDKDNNLWLLNLETKANQRIATDEHANASPAFAEFRWSPDSRWLAFEQSAPNSFDQVKVHGVETGQTTALTTDRYNSGSPAWSVDGKYLYLVSGRSLRSQVSSPLGSRAPDPYFDRQNKIYQIALQKGLRSPFEPADELRPEKKEASKDEKTEKPRVEIDFDRIQERIEEVPAPPGNYRDLFAAAKRLCWRNIDRADPEKTKVECLDIQNKGDKPETLLEGVSLFEVSADGKKMLLRKGNDLYVVDSAVRESAMKTPKTLTDARVNLADWTFSVIPTEEFKEALHDAWRLHRDYFYDRNMHGVNWALLRDKYAELAGRVRDRSELSHLIAQMVSELSALHTTVEGGDLRTAPDQIRLAVLGARLARSETAGGWVVEHIYRSDPDRPDKRGPLARPGVDVQAGDAIVAINGRDTLAVTHPYELLRNQQGKQVLLRVKPASGTATRDVLVKPIPLNEETDLRYGEWEYTRRLKVEEAAGGQIGYMHLRAMGPNDIAQFAENYYPVFDRQGLIIDVRHNGGGNIDSWILGKLMRKAWMYWQGRVGKPYWNMQYAFRGHMVVLSDEWTASDGEAFAEGFRRLGLGPVIGTRSWGGEIWLTGSNRLADRGVATAAEKGVYGPEGKWLIEGHGVDPDIVVDNLPHATFNGKDAQLEAAIRHLQERIKKQPNPVPPHPPYPDKSPRTGGASAVSGGSPR